MIFNVHLLYDKGWLLPRFRSAFVAPVSGVLQVRQERESTAAGWVMVARLLDLKTGGPVASLRPLYDAKLMLCETDHMVLRGFERVSGKIGTREHECVQAWLLEPIPSEPDNGDDQATT